MRSGVANTSVTADFLKGVTEIVPVSALRAWKYKLRVRVGLLPQLDQELQRWRDSGK